MQPIDYPAQPSCVFTHPQLASVGLSEEEAKSRFKSVTVKSSDASHYFNAKRVNAKTYAYKTILNDRDGAIVGAQLVGPDAAETINLFMLVIAGEIDKAQLKKLIFTYPSWGSDIKGMC
jgi:glutathione reductase (NADPH)